MTKGTLQCCAINNEGKLISCGDLHGKIHVFQLTTINKKMKKNDTTIKLVQKKQELSGHGTLVTCCQYLNNNYLISGSDDSDILLWDLEKPARYLVKYSDHQFEL